MANLSRVRYLTLKAILDRILASALIAVLAPLFLLIAGVSYLLQGRPIFFVQIRIGFNERPFRLYKFRTMGTSRCIDGSEVEYERVTKLGKFLREYSLDELPQLINVFRGEMSFVGPRPLLMEYLEHYSVHERERHRVRPGITGLAQISGRNSLSWKERFSLDLTYVEHVSLAFDLTILFRTLGVVMSRDGAAAEISQFSEKFSDK